MKQIIIFAAGLITGCALTFLVLMYSRSSAPEKEKAEETVTEVDVSNEGTDKYGNYHKFFDEPADVIESQSFEVLQALSGGAALVRADDYLGVKCLLMNDEGKDYYDDQIVKVPAGKVARQIGIYRYKNYMGLEKTVPIVKIMNE